MAGIYIHIPFCVKKCAYCDFVSFENSPHVRQYVNALKAEMEISAFRLPYRRYDTVFVGGGTPSILPPGMMRQVFDALKAKFDLANDAEITVECNPGTVDREKLNEYLSCGVNRLSFGLQSANDRLLGEIGRIHVLEDFLKSCEAARQEGFQNINADVMYGLPKQTVDDLSQTLDVLFTLPVEHVSAYSLILEEGTPLFKRVERGETVLPDEDEAYQMHRFCIDKLQNAGYERYEISNYARRLKAGEKSPWQCRHNLNYWNNGEYLGVGLNAHSAMRLETGGWTRWSNAETLTSYFSSIDGSLLPAGEKMPISRGEEMFETVMLAFRKTEGLSLSSFFERFGVAFEIHYKKAIATLDGTGYLAIEKGFARLSERGLDMQNEVLLHFMEEN